MLLSATKYFPVIWPRDIDAGFRDEDLGPTIVATSVAVYSCCTIFVLARILLRLRLSTKPTSDDYLTVLALVCSHSNTPVLMKRFRFEDIDTSTDFWMGRGSFHGAGRSERTWQTHHHVGSRRRPIRGAVVHDRILSHVVLDIVTESGRCGAPRPPDDSLKGSSISPLEFSCAMLSRPPWTFPYNMDPMRYNIRLPEYRDLSQLFHICWE